MGEIILFPSLKNKTGGAHSRSKCADVHELNAMPKCSYEEVKRNQPTQAEVQKAWNDHFSAHSDSPVRWPPLRFLVWKMGRSKDAE
jgi:hypothetical protein